MMVQSMNGTTGVSDDIPVVSEKSLPGAWSVDAPPSAALVCSESLDERPRCGRCKVPTSSKLNHFDCKHLFCLHCITSHTRCPLCNSIKKKIWGGRSRISKFKTKLPEKRKSSDSESEFEEPVVKSKWAKKSLELRKEPAELVIPELPKAENNPFAINCKVEFVAAEVGCPLGTTCEKFTTMGGFKNHLANKHGVSESIISSFFRIHY